MAVFVSYSHHDAGLVERFALELVKRNIKVWRDVWRNAAGEDFVKGIHEALGDASCACIFASRNSLKSAWVTEETRLAVERSRQNPEFLIIPIRLDDSDLPNALRDRIAVDCCHDPEAGLQKVLRAIDGVENRPPKGRLNLEGSYYIHFGIEQRQTSEGHSMLLDVVSFDLEETYCVLSQFEFWIPGPEPWKQLALDAPEEIRAHLLKVCARHFAKEPAVVKVTERDVKRARFTIADAQGNAQVQVSVRITALGSGPSKTLTFNGGALFEQVCRASGIPLDRPGRARRRSARGPRRVGPSKRRR